MKCLTNHDSRRHGVPLEPECDERACDKYYSRNEDCGEVEGTISREDEIHLKAAVVTCISKNAKKKEYQLCGSKKIHISPRPVFPSFPFTF